MIVDILLDKYISDCSKQEFEWGKLDCALFVSGWVEVLTGENPAKQSIGKYSTKIGANRHLVKIYGSLQKAADDRYMRVPVKKRQKGDIALCDMDFGKTFGIIGVRGFVWFKTENMGVIQAKPKILNVWRVI